MLLGKVLSIVAASAALLDGSMKVALPDKNALRRFQKYPVNIDVVSRFRTPAQMKETLRKVEATGMSQSMRDDAATALEEMFAAAKEEGVTLSTVSGYRSYSKQATIYARKKASQGEEEADRVSARPGTSEHQLGLAMDISKKNSSQLNTSFAETEEGQWVAANAHRFGFIVRYLKEYEDVTGYMYEPWHVRYVGKEQAQAIYESGVPMETYMTGYKLGVYDFLIHQATNE